MTFETRTFRRLGVGLAAGGACFIVAALPGAAPAAADPWDSMLGFFGMHNGQSQDDTIDYSARPALVVPPKMDLPPPQTAVARPADWPKDPDVDARRRAELDSRRPAPPPADPSTIDDSSDPTASNAPDTKPKPKVDAKTAEFNSRYDTHLPGLGSGAGKEDSGVTTAVNMPKDDCTSVAGLPVCGFSPMDWLGLGNKDEEKVQTLKIGAEPPRKYLTQPPPGYRMPSVGPDDDADSATDSGSGDTSTHSGKKVSTAN